MASGPPSKISFGMIDEDEGSYLGSSQNQAMKQQTTIPTVATTSAPQKKKRNLPGTPNPDAEVIALSPKTLMATNRFLCEVCGKGFQREQNLQLHRRGHNLPWKLKQKSTKEVRKRVYLCPEPTCVHHDPSRALGDLTGIKKHFCRKHGEKKWKCEKCSKRYAVQSDWKAHSKTCGTREYRCDCGTLFSRRDSFITHRAFCDALAQESARLPSGLNTVGGQQLYSNSMAATLALSHMASSMVDTNSLRLAGAAPTATQFDLLGPPTSNLSFRLPPPAPQVFFSSTGASNQDFNHEDNNQLPQNKPSSSSYTGSIQLPEFTDTTGSINGCASKVPNNIFNLGFYPKGDGIRSNNNLQSSPFSVQEQFNGASVCDQIVTSSIPSLYNSQMQKDLVNLPQMSATALLQKAAQLGATASSNHDNFLRTFSNPTANNTSHDSPPIGVTLPWHDQRPASPLSSSLPISTQSHCGNKSQILPALIPPKDLRDLDCQMKPGFSSGNDQDILSSFLNGGVSGRGGIMFRNEHGRSDDCRFGDYGSHMNHLELQRAKVSNDQKKLRQQTAGGMPSSSGMGSSEGLTRDFLGVGGMNTGFIGGAFSKRDHLLPQQQQQQNVNLVTLDSEVKTLARPYGERIQ